MASVANTSYVLDSRQKTGGSTVSSATYNLAALGSPVEAGTYEMLSFNSRNNVYNVDAGNNEIYFSENAGAELGPAVLPSGYYANEADLGTAVKDALELAGLGTYTLVYDTLTNLYTISVAGAVATFNFNWGTNSSQPIANLLLGFAAVDTPDQASVTSDRGVDLDPHSNLLIRITQDGSKNVTLVDGTEYSLIVPLTSAYGEEIESLKSVTFDQTVLFSNSMNQLDVQLFTENGVALPEVNAAQYECILRRLF